MLYGSEKLLPSYLLHNSPRVDLYSEAEAEEASRDGLDLLEEEHEMALIRSTLCKQDLCRYHDRHVRGRVFQERDLVLRVDQQKPHKLAPHWERPFSLSKVLHNGAYRLYNFAKETEEPIAWNADLLCRFYN